MSHARKARLNALVKLPATLKDGIRRWRQDRRGTLAVVYSLVLVPILSIFGIAVNYSTAFDQRLAYQSIADAAALAGATASATDSDTARKARAQAWFDTQVALQNLPKPTISVSVNAGKVIVESSATITPLWSMVNFGPLTVKVSSTAEIASTIIRRALDVVFCIDATGSMSATINAVKTRAKSFSDDLNNALKARGLEAFDYTRIRGVFYRDFYADTGTSVYYWGWGWYMTPEPMVKSDFYVMPSNKTGLTTFLGTQSASGGGDLPESGYECINEGMESKWMKVGDAIPGSSYKVDKIYPVIVLWTDADALPIGHALSVAAVKYPANMPRTQATYTAKWSNGTYINQENKMLVMFGPCSWSSWSVARSLAGYMCGGTLNDGNTNMVNKIADAMQVRYKNLNARLTK